MRVCLRGSKDQVDYLHRYVVPPQNSSAHWFADVLHHDQPDAGNGFMDPARYSRDRARCARASTSKPLPRNFVTFFTVFENDVFEINETLANYDVFVSWRKAWDGISLPILLFLKIDPRPRVSFAHPSTSLSLLKLELFSLTVICDLKQSAIRFFLRPKMFSNS